MVAWMTREIRLKLYKANTPFEVPSELFHGAKFRESSAVAHRSGEYEGVKDSIIQGVEVLLRDEQNVRQIVSDKPDMFELAA